MKPEIIFKPGFFLVGMKYEGRNEKGEISELWKKFSERIFEIKNRVNEKECYGLSIYSEKFFATGEFLYLAAVEVVKIEEVPEEMVAVEVDPAKYAVFTLPGEPDKLPKLIHEIYCRYLKEEGLKPVGNYDFELYNERYPPNQKDSKIYFFVPVE
ncbi:GyrI-like domain-containing protein [Carboxydothermus hydrogenoformans]|uniref:AraC effector-binding domain-containing protein n=1 Tax=Carboxydothermus hydrogenoformans (strain ATCC BAA-161 / DSM 6008 / Z-2901) TaxID=246194 RepID=Q3AFY4_CARHZ|nr:GyrI-like domain-containing protein [Carboxydothermus hydrogenoformans]ABB14329.1 conserved hypothetical protein [Carboxydothermus hydrogenoformans Z-2901]